VTGAEWNRAHAEHLESPPAVYNTAVRSTFIPVLLGAMILAPAEIAAQTFEGRAKSADGDIVVSYSVKDGYLGPVELTTSRRAS
jgi:hypothetical protein